LIPVTLLPVAFSLLGPLYVVTALVLGGWFLQQARRLVHEGDDACARRLFRVSLIQLTGVFLAMILDLAWRVGAL
jgi:protoheme IX farnesyltransferase